MSKTLKDWREVSLLVFGLRIKAPELEFYDQLRYFILNHEHLKHIVPVIQEFPQILSDLSKTQPDVARWLSKTRHVDDLVEWISGRDNDIVGATSGYVVLPLLALIQLAQYFDFLKRHDIDHHAFVSHIRHAGGVQGYCGGLPCALAVASSHSEAELRHNFAVSVRLAFVIGILGEVADDHHDGFEMMVVRLKHAGQGDALVKLFPEVVISAITDPKSITLSGSRSALLSLAGYVREQGMHVHQWPLKGKWHHPHNLKTAQMLSAWCKDKSAYTYDVGMIGGANPRSNHTNNPIAGDNLTDELIFGILAHKSDWHGVLTKVARKIQGGQSSPQHIVNFGVGDSIPLTAFNELGLPVRKFDAHAMLRETLQDQSMPSTGDEIPYPDHTVAIVGASCRLPGANNLAELWSLLSKGQDQHRKLDMSRFSIADSHRLQLAGNTMKGKDFFANLLKDVDVFDNGFFSINSKEAINMDPQQRIMLELAYEAIESSGYSRLHKRKNGDQIGCFIGASAVDYHENTSAYAPSAYTATGTIRAFISGKISHHFGWTGPSEVIDTACSSSLVAIHRACKALESGECQMALAGGVNVMTSPNCFFDLGRAGFLSPTGQCKPFDQSADGYCRSDGAGLVVLKSLGLARRDGDTVLGVIPASHVNQSGLSSSITVPSLDSQVDLFRRVLDKAKMDPQHLSYVEAHGTGTQVGDPIEMNSLRTLFSTQRSSPVHIGSVKGNIGHCETAAGVAGLLKVLAMLQHGKIPPQANFRTLNPKISPLDPENMVIPVKELEWCRRDRIALINSYGASGANAALVVRGPPQPQVRAPNRTLSTSVPIYSQPIMLSAATPNSVRKHTQVLSHYLAQSSNPPSLKDIAFTFNSRRKLYKHRVMVKASSTGSLCQNLEAGTYESYEVSDKAIPVVLALSGQSSRTGSVSRELYDRYSRLRAHLNECNEILVELGYPAIIPAIFSLDEIKDPVTLHTALVASQIAFSFCWIESGIRVAAVIGHSIGELAALAVTGVLSVRDCLKLVAYRAILIQKKWGVDKGAMIAISSSSFRLKQLTHEIAAPGSNYADIEVACYNSDTSYVLAGSTAAIHQFERTVGRTVEGDQILIQHLDISHGYHSKLTSPILDDLNIYSQSLDWRQPVIPLETCSETGDKVIAPPYVSEHARQAVFFHKAVQRLESRFGSCVWLEGGMNTPIIPLVRRALAQIEQHRLFPVSSNSATLSAEIVSETVCRLWREGVETGSWVHMESSDCTAAWLPPYQFDGHSHWLPYVDRVITDTNIQNHEIKEKPPPPVVKMVVMMKQSESHGSALFKVNTDCERFRQLLNGHVVRRSAMAPAALYVECAAMAMYLWDSKVKLADLKFCDIRYHAPLGSKGQQLTSLLLERDQATNVTRFEIRSKPESSGPPHDVLHATGTIKIGNDVPFEVFQRLLATEQQPASGSDCKETLKSARAYKLFERVVRYESFFRGISTISLEERTATATVQLPSEQPGIESTDVASLFDAVFIDMFIQPLGLLVNSSDLVREDEVMVGAGIDSVAFSSSLENHRSTTLTVFTKFSMTNQTEAVGDVMVYSATGSLVGIVTGCRFSKIQVSRLEKILNKTKTKPDMLEAQSAQALELVGASSNLKVSPPRMPLSVPDMEGTFHQSPTKKDGTVSAASLKNLLALYTGLDVSAIGEDVKLSDLGIDSLATQELAMDLSSKYDVDVDSMTLQDHSIQSIRSLKQFSQSFDSQSESSELSGTLSDSTRTSLSSNNSEVVSTMLYSILSQYSGVKMHELQDSILLADIGIDSLALLELQQEISEKILVDVSVSPDSSIHEIMSAIEEEAGRNKGSRPSVIAPQVTDSTPGERPRSPTQIFDRLGSPAKDTSRTVDLPTLLRNNDMHFEATARSYGFDRYWSKVAPDQDELVLAYINEAFLELGVNLNELLPGTPIPRIPVLDKYSKVMDRFLGILGHHRVIQVKQGVNVRGTSSLPSVSSSELHARFLSRHPRYRCEAEVMALSGTTLAACLSGRADPMHCLFGSPKAWKCMETFYYDAPLLATATEQLVNLVVEWVTTVAPSKSRPLRILEVGAGTGGTTRRLAKALKEANFPVCYTFSDISPSMLRRAQIAFSEYKWMDFMVLDLEKDPPSQLMESFDLVIGTNSVHATSDRTSVMGRLRSMLNETGFAIISETTRTMNWFDLVFGLLDGWWFAEKGMAYPLQSSEVWMQYFHNAGFKSCISSQGDSLESRTQQLLLACRQDIIPAPPARNLELAQAPKMVNERMWEMHTFVYKTVNGVDIDADIYLPTTSPTSAMPIALLIHGGGGVYLSKSSVQASHIAYLLSQGVLPVSLNFRLCPETNLLDGAMVDIQDAYRWVKTDLQRTITAKLHETTSVNVIRINSDRIAAIGYSSGTQLALSLVWTTKESDLPAPSAVVAFYGPVIFSETSALNTPKNNNLPPRTLAWEEIFEKLPTQPIVQHAVPASSSSQWMRSNDPRAELIRAFFHEDVGLPILLNRIPCGPAFRSSGMSVHHALAQPGQERINAICPLAQLRSHGSNWQTPTYLMHGDQDDMAPFEDAVAFYEELKATGVNCGMLALKGAGHLFDIGIQVGSQKWAEQVEPGLKFLCDQLNSRYQKNG